MKKFIFLFLGICFLTIIASYSADFYTSITKVEYVSSGKVLKISSKVNAEHIQQALGKKIGVAGFDAALSAYVQNNVKVGVNDAPYSVVYSSSNQESSVVWIYYEVRNVENISSLSVKNTLLMDKFPDQQNFVNLIINGNRKSFVCKKGAEVGKVNF
ncbi:MAG: hypothetical protein LBT29_09325 [Flavobacteriaceae bacterium]|jgi:hypothetical protein|nr:hypothetical protein [Flavobacteriaceae bacterium]